MKYNTICKVPMEVRKSLNLIIKRPNKGVDGHMYDCGRIVGILETITVLGIITWTENNDLFDYYTAWYWHAVGKEG